MIWGIGPCEGLRLRNLNGGTLNHDNSTASTYDNEACVRSVLDGTRKNSVRVLGNLVAEAQHTASSARGRAGSDVVCAAGRRMI